MEEKILTIIDTQGNLEEVYLNQYRKDHLLVGRNKQECDIAICDSIISRCHGTIWIDGDEVYYRDEDSSNGTFFGIGEEKRLLSKKDGFVRLYDKTILRIGNLNKTDDMVLILFTSETDKETWKREELDKKDVLIGRSQSCQIFLSNPGVSKIHCQVFYENDRYIFRDCNSKNGSLINGFPVTEDVVLRDKDVIQILGYQLFFSGESIYFKTTASGVSLRVCNVSKTVGAGKKRKKILQNVDCEIKANEFVAIIGGSGAGKTTLMNAISGFEPGFSGKVYCNGADMIKNFQRIKSVIGFVPQQDIIYENLTLERMLEYSSRLRMPKDTDTVERKKRIKEVLKMVDLEGQKNTLIRKLSGGQKKRASIAVELLADPKLFFLDEPTSGLDPGTEKNLMISLKTLARQHGKTIIMVTHTTANLHLCDKILFMGPGGKLCFCGNVKEAKKFYQTEDLVDIYNMVSQNTEFWEKRYSAYAKNSPPVKENKDSYEKDKKLKKESAFSQFFVLIERYAELLLHDKPRLMILFLQPGLIAVLLYIVADDKIFQIYESTKSILFALSCSAIWIGLFNSIQEICKERVIVKREYMANLRLTGYVLSKVVLQALIGVVQAIVLTETFLILVDKQKEGIFFDNYSVEIVFTIWLTILASTAMGLIISALVKSGDKAMTVAPFVLIVQLLFSGILFMLEGAGKKISYCTVSRWSVEALGSIAHLNSLELKMQKEYPMLEHKAESFFKATAGHVSYAWMILIAMTAICIVSSIVVLRRIAKDTR